MLPRSLLAFYGELSRCFPEGVFDRGMSIATRDDADRLIDWKPPAPADANGRPGNWQRLIGAVQGSHRYHVVIEANDAGQIQCSCTCPFFSDRRIPCKHVVAFLLEGAKRGSWLPIREVRSVRAIGDDRPARGPTEGEAPEEGQDGERSRRRRRRRRGRRGRGRGNGQGDAPLDPAATPPQPSAGDAPPAPTADTAAPTAHRHGPNHRHQHQQGQHHGRHHRGHEGQHGRHQGRHQGRPLPPPLPVVENDEWRATLAPATPEAPAALVYALPWRQQLSFHRPFTVYRRIERDGRIHLTPFDLATETVDVIDELDRTMLGELRQMQARHWIGPDSVARLIERVVKGGRLHARLGPMALGPAIRWRGDVQWKAEMHIELLESAARRWVRLVAPGESPIDCLQPAAAQVGNLFILGDSAIDATHRIAARNGNVAWQRPAFDATTRLLVTTGARTYLQEELPDLALEVRYDNDHAEHPELEETRPILCLDPRFAVTFFEARPSGVLRISGGGSRKTVDVEAIARYTHPTEKDILVDRDARTHRIIESIDQPLRTVPRGQPRDEREIERAGSEALRAAKGTIAAIWRFPTQNMPAFLAAAARRGLAVEFEKRPTRSAIDWSISVTSGTDWFDLDGSLQTPEGLIPLRDLVTAAQRSPEAIEVLALEDGSNVYIPENFRALLRRLANLMSRRESDELRFARSEALLLDGLLEGAPNKKVDPTFTTLRDRLQSFETPAPLPAPTGFEGTLRAYQECGLGWMAGLRQLGLGGCLADEMGLGKTVQVLAMLASLTPADFAADDEPVVGAVRHSALPRSKAATKKVAKALAKKTAKKVAKKAAKKAAKTVAKPMAKSAAKATVASKAAKKVAKKVAKAIEKPGRKPAPKVIAKEPAAKLVKAVAAIEDKAPKPAAKRASKRAPRAMPPSLLVVPRSIVRNWLDEARRFAPNLRVLDLSHSERSLDDATFEQCDVALITYGTLVRDVDRLAAIDFGYVILDEAQAIKNATTRAAKAAKALKARHRLAMTGTPIENHIGELWSLFEFLNPGMSKGLERLAARSEDGDLSLVRRAVGPMILRRTKREVAKDLPERIEQTIRCDMTEAQEEHYRALVERVRADLLGAVDHMGLEKSRMEVLTGLLRLRQVACHPVLVDKRRLEAGSGKLDTLLPMLEESAEEGRKTLVFSQFTSFLAIVRAELDARGITYEYLDGATTDRGERVARFRDDPACAVFLLSLKAGGVGLNLQAAERVILLDPWWNPAVEAQAIDRAHRIGQQRTVHALRLVCGGTVEERVLELQQKKRHLIDAIIGEDAGPLASLTRDDLEFLLSVQPSATSVPAAHGRARKRAVVAAT